MSLLTASPENRRGCVRRTTHRDGRFTRLRRDREIGNVGGQAWNSPEAGLTTEETPIEGELGRGD
jgi:hypothetical protein